MHDVRDWLESIGLGQYADALEDAAGPFAPRDVGDGEDLESRFREHRLFL